MSRRGDVSVRQRRRAGGGEDEKDMTIGSIQIPDAQLQNGDAVLMCMQEGEGETAG